VQILKNLLSNITISKNSVIFILVTVVIAVLAYAKVSGDRMRESLAAYENPSKVSSRKATRWRGSVKITEKKTTKPDGETVTERIEERGPVLTASDRDSRTEPVFPEIPVNQDRFLVGASYRFSRPNGAMGWLGYSFSNRLDLLIGCGKGTGAEGAVMAVTRWGK
jgi:hypothetical protein